MKDSLGIDKTCENCLHWNDGCGFKPSHKRQSGVCLRNVYFAPSNNAMESRILELQVERDKFKAFVQRARNISHERSAIIALHDEARALLSGESEVRNER